MGSCASKPRMMYDDYYDPDDGWHYGDQSWQFYRAQDIDAIYDSEFQPEAPKRKKPTASGIRGKIESLRQSFFNQGKSLAETPTVKRRESKGLKGKFQNWRRSWFGPEPSPKPIRKLSFSQTVLGSKEEPIMRSQKKPRLSQSSVKRLSVTRNFVEKYGQVEEVYGETSKSAPSDEPIEHHDLHPQIKVQFHGSETQETVAPKSPGPETEEEEISECKIESRTAEREFLSKIKEIGSVDHELDSDEDISELKQAMDESVEKIRKESVTENDILVEEENGGEVEDITEQINSQRSKKEITNDKENTKEEDYSNEEQEEIEKEDQCGPKDDKKLNEGLALFNDSYGSEDESPVEEIKLTGEECSENRYSAQNGGDSEDSQNYSTVSDEEYEHETRRVDTKSEMSVTSNVNRRAGARIQISSKGRN